MENVKGDVAQEEFLILDNCNNGETYKTIAAALKGAATMALPDRDVVIYQAVQVVRQQVVSEPIKRS